MQYAFERKQPVKQIVLKVATTGLDHREGHRMMELACVELVDRQLSGRQFHWYFNPERDIDPDSYQRYGLTAEFLSDKPKFADVADELTELLRGAELVAHNALFAVSFLDHELQLAGLPTVDTDCAGTLDTLRLTRETLPGQQVNLNALCERYQIDVSDTEAPHDALVDAMRLAEVYLKMSAQ